MRKYVTRPSSSNRAAWDEWWESDPVTITVHETESTPRPTGIYDRLGNEFHSINERGPIGFVRFK